MKPEEKSVAKEKAYGKDDAKIGYGREKQIADDPLFKPMEVPAKRGIFARMKDSVTGWFGRTFVTGALGKVFSPIVKAVGSVMDSKIYKILSSKPVGYAVSIAFAAAAVVFAPVVALPLAAAALGLTVVGTLGKMTKDALNVRHIEKLKRKDLAMTGLVDALALKEVLCRLDPSAKEVLKSWEIEQNTRTMENSRIRGKLKNAARIADYANNFFGAAQAVVSLNPVSIGTTAIGLGTGLAGSYSLSKAMKNMKDSIETSLKESGLSAKLSEETIKSLAENERKKAQALRSLVSDPGYLKMSNEDRVAKFDNFFKEADNEKRLSKDSAGTSLPQKITDPVALPPKRSVFRNFLTSLNPFSTVLDPSSVKPSGSNFPLASNMRKEEASKKIKEEKGPKELIQSLSKEINLAKEEIENKNKEIPIKKKVIDDKNRKRSNSQEL